MHLPIYANVALANYSKPCQVRMCMYALSGGYNSMHIRVCLILYDAI